MCFRLLTEFEESSSVEVNTSGFYNTVCVELDMASLAVNTLMQVGGHYWSTTVVRISYFKISVVLAVVMR